MTAIAERTAEAERRVEVSRATVTHSEHAHREHDVEDVQHAERDLLRAEQPDERSGGRLADDDGEALDSSCPHARARRAGSQRGR